MFYLSDMHKYPCKLGTLSCALIDCHLIRLLKMGVPSQDNRGVIN